MKQLLGTKTFRIYFSFGDALVRPDIACLLIWRGTRVGAAGLGAPGGFGALRRF